MKSVEEYINEKHNFIFGGKAGLTGKEYEDDAKTFGELEEGDYLFWSDPISKKGERVRIHQRAISNIERIKGMHKYTLRPFGELVVPDIYIEDKYYFNEFRNCKIVYATNADDFLKIVNDFSGVTHTEDNIILVEANQNFIFGGKSGLTGKEYEDGAKTFGELEEGDTFYAASIEFFDEDYDFIYTVKLIGEEKYANQICINIETADTHSWTFPKKYVNDSSITWIDTEIDATTIVVSTDLDEFLYLLRKNGVKENVIDACKRKAEMKKK